MSAIVLSVRRFQHDELGRQLFRVWELPESARHCDLCGREEEQLVHILENCAVGVEVDHALILRLAESEEF